jgi:hypothetical protein
MSRPRYGFDAPFALFGLVTPAVLLVAGGDATAARLADVVGWPVAADVAAHRSPGRAVTSLPGQRRRLVVQVERRP